FVVEEAERVLAHAAGEQRGAAWLALADDLGERHVEQEPLLRWRGAFRATLYQLALADRVVARAATIRARPVVGERSLEAAAAEGWSRRLAAEARASGDALAAHCDHGRPI